MNGDAPRWPDKPALDNCRRCSLWMNATQGVPGAGPRGAAIVVVGEQPGDEEDRQGVPFVGPAGRLLRSAIASAGLDVTRLYLTNAVKHFGWVLRGKRRMHKTPQQRQIDACSDWLEAEIALQKPRVVVALGRTALRALLGRSLKVSESRGRALALPDGTPVIATYHPSAILRASDDAERRQLQGALEADLRRAGDLTL